MSYLANLILTTSILALGLWIIIVSYEFVSRDAGHSPIDAVTYDVLEIQFILVALI